MAGIYHHRPCAADPVRPVGTRVRLLWGQLRLSTARRQPQRVTSRRFGNFSHPDRPDSRRHRLERPSNRPELTGNGVNFGYPPRIGVKSLLNSDTRLLCYLGWEADTPFFHLPAVFPLFQPRQISSFSKPDRPGRLISPSPPFQMVKTIILRRHRRR